MSIGLILNENGNNGVPVKIFTKDVEQKALNQLYAMSQLQFIHSHIAVMPDVHAGKGATVGSVIPTKSAIIPSAVGVDIGCGMNALRLSIKAEQLPDNLKPARLAIEKHVPVGFEKHKQIMAKMSTLDPLAIRLKKITDKHKGLLKMMSNFDRTWQNSLARWAVAITLLSCAWTRTMTCGLCFTLVLVGLARVLASILSVLPKK